MSREETLSKLYGSAIEVLFNLEGFLDEKRVVERIISLQSKALRESIMEVWRPDDKPRPSIAGRPPAEPDARDLEYYHEKVGSFTVVASNLGRTIDFTPVKDHANNTKSASELRSYLKSLQTYGVSFMFYSDESSRLTVVIPPNFVMSGVLKAVSVAYKAIKDGNGVI